MLRAAAGRGTQQCDQWHMVPCCVDAFALRIVATSATRAAYMFRQRNKSGLDDWRIVEES